MSKVIYVASPHGGKPENIEKNAEYCRQVILAGHIPLSPHHNLSYMDEATERKAAIHIGLRLMAACAEAWFFVEYGVTAGMIKEMRFARKIGKNVVIFGNPPKPGEVCPRCHAGFTLSPDGRCSRGRDCWSRQRKTGKERLRQEYYQEPVPLQELYIKTGGNCEIRKNDTRKSNKGNGRP